MSYSMNNDKQTRFLMTVCFFLFCLSFLLIILQAAAFAADIDDTPALEENVVKKDGLSYTDGYRYLGEDGEILEEPVPETYEDYLKVLREDGVSGNLHFEEEVISEGREDAFLPEELTIGSSRFPEPEEAVSSSVDNSSPVEDVLTEPEQHLFRSVYTIGASGDMDGPEPYEDIKAIRNNFDFLLYGLIPILLAVFIICKSCAWFYSTFIRSALE